MLSTYDFLVIVEPCVVDSYDILMRANPITNNVRATGITGASPFSFVQSPNCGYTETVEVTNLPVFLQYNSATQDFDL